MARDIKMCVINADVVEEIRDIVGPQSAIMMRMGISWNSWIKVEGGMPIRLSLGQRLRMRVLERLDELPGLAAKFPPRSPGEAIDRQALERSFLKPVTICGGSDERALSVRSVRQARAMTASQQQAAF